MANSEKSLDVVSVGDCVIDCLFYVDRTPKRGETMKANNFAALPGGKGANYSIASSRLGSRSALICKIGNDMFGNTFSDILAKDKINAEHVTVTTTSPTSVASILVDTEGYNYISVNFGATLELNEDDIERADSLIARAKVLTVSMVVKSETALHSLKVAKRNNLITIFNFAPATEDLSPEFNKYVDILVVNEVEAEVFTGSTVNNVDDAVKACKIVLEREGFYIGVIVTLGEKGCVFGDKKTGLTKHFPAKKLKCSLAHYVSALGSDSMHRSIDLAIDYASLTVQEKGTQSSYPHIDNIDARFRV